MIEVKHDEKDGQSKYQGLFTAITPQNDIENIFSKYQDVIISAGIKFIIAYQIKSESFYLIAVNHDKQLDTKDFWVEFLMNDIVPFLRK